MNAREFPPPWTLLSNHGHVLLCIASETNPRLREVAERVGITERAVQRIVGELEASGFIDRRREGRRNHYVVHADAPLRHPLEAHHDVGRLLALFKPPNEG